MHSSVHGNLPVSVFSPGACPGFPHRRVPSRLPPHAGHREAPASLPCQIHGKIPHLHRRGITIPDPDGPPIVPLSRHRLAFSAPGGASALSMACRVRSEHDHAFHRTLVTAKPPLRSPARSMAKYRISTVAALRFPTLTGRQSCRFLDTASLFPPPAALRRCPWRAV